jgi:hypothetical protein
MRTEDSVPARMRHATGASHERESNRMKLMN